MKKLYTPLIFLLLLTGKAYTQWTGAGNGMDSYVWGSAVYNGKLFACGNFEHADGNTCLGIAQWDGTSWSDVGGGFQTNAFVHVVRGLIVFNNELIAGGYVDSAGGVAVNRVARWNGTSWSPMGTNMPISTINCFTIHNGELYAGGNSGSSPNYHSVAKWDGSGWTAIDAAGQGGDITALASYNGNLYAGGNYLTINGQNIMKLAYWDGSAWNDAGGGFTMLNNVRSLAVFNGSLYIGGAFATAGGVTVNNIAQLNGTTWSALAGGVNSDVQSLFSYGNKLFVGGAFWQVNGNTANRAAYWDGSNWTVLGTDLGSGAKTISVYNNELYYGGEGAFNNQNYFARWTGGTFTGIHESATSNSVQLFPNPVVDEVHVVFNPDFLNNETRFVLSDITGKEVLEQNLLESVSRVDCTGLSPGIYLYRILSGTDLIDVGKLIVSY
jgi:hypothetical protein